MRLIDVAVWIPYLREYWQWLSDGEYADGFRMAIDLLEKAPTIEAEPVKHGRWEKYYHSYFGQHQCVCSECKDDSYWKKYYCYGVESYCPNCGAKMDGGNNDG